MKKFITLRGGQKMQKIVYHFFATQCSPMYLALMKVLKKYSKKNHFCSQSHAHTHIFMAKWIHHWPQSLSICNACYVENHKMQLPCWFVTIVLEDGISIVFYHCLPRFQEQIRYVHDAPNGLVLLFCVRPQYHNIYICF